jgi:DNA-binding beta-propeller fold protein YncE
MMEAFSIKTVKQSRLLRVMGVLAASSLAAAVAVPGVAWADTSAIPAIAIGSTPVGLAVDSVTDMAYTTDTLAKAISVIDLSTDRATATINLNFDPSALAVDPTTDTVYLDGRNSLLAINGATDKVVHAITMSGSDGFGIAVDPRTDTVYSTGVQGLFSSVTTGSTGSSNFLWLAGGVAVIVLVSGGAALKRRRAVHDNGLRWAN